MFSFGFSGDDIEADETDVHSGLDQGSSSAAVAQGQDKALPELVPAQRHEISEWISTLPSQISYNTLTINAAEDDTPSPATSLTIARREIFDIRTQLMAEDSADHENEELISGLEQGDLKPNFYEGGFKTWECALDLAKVVVAENALSADGDQHVIELGSGTAVPSLALFAQLLSRPASSDNRKIRLTFADYNAVVLRLVTLPNLILTWNHIINSSSSSSHRTGAEQGADAPQPPAEEEAKEEEEELDITPDLLSSFQQDLANRNITIDFISGAWSPAFVDLVTTTHQHQYKQTLILASETIYAPASLAPFSETLLQLLRRSAPEEQKRALIAAKKVYFGVGGGVDEFLAVLGRIGGDAVEVVQRLDVQSGGVGRVVLGVNLV